MAITNGNYVTPAIANTTQLEKLRDGVLYGYSITPVSGYILHDKGRDFEDIDFDTGADIPKLGFTRGSTTVILPYDFNENPREFYTLPDNGEIPENQIFGGSNNNDQEKA